jgi:hypothetical protein
VTGGLMKRTVAATCLKVRVSQRAIGPIEPTSAPIRRRASFRSTPSRRILTILSS